MAALGLRRMLKQLLLVKEMFLYILSTEFMVDVLNNFLIELCSLDDRSLEEKK